VRPAESAGRPLGGKPGSASSQPCGASIARLERIGNVAGSDSLLDAAFAWLEAHSWPRITRPVAIDASPGWRARRAWLSTRTDRPGVVFVSDGSRRIVGCVHAPGGAAR
jgi:hypothetical protein